MTRATLRLLVGGLSTAGLLAGVTRGDDKNSPAQIPTHTTSALVKTESSIVSVPDPGQFRVIFDDSPIRITVPVLGPVPLVMDLALPIPLPARMIAPILQPAAARVRLSVPTLGPIPITLDAAVPILAPTGKVGTEPPAESKPINVRNERDHWQFVAIHLSENIASELKGKIAELMKEYHASYKAQTYREVKPLALKAHELDPENYVINGRPRPVNSPNRSDNEREINRRLDAPVTAFDYRDVSLQQILDDLAAWSEINIVPNIASLKAAHISLEQPISMGLEGATLKTALNLLLQKARLKYKVENDCLVIVPDGLVHPGLDCFTDPERRANQGASLHLSPNGLKLLGVDLAAGSPGHPHLPPSAPRFVLAQEVNCPINTPPYELFIGGRYPRIPVEPPSPLTAFMPPEPVYLDQSVSRLFEEPNRFETSRSASK